MNFPILWKFNVGMVFWQFVWFVSGVDRAVAKSYLVVATSHTVSAPYTGNNEKNNNSMIGTSPVIY